MFGKWNLRRVTSCSAPRVVYDLALCLRRVALRSVPAVTLDQVHQRSLCAGVAVAGIPELPCENTHHVD